MFLFALLIAFIALSLGVAWYLIAHDRGEREPVMALWAAVAFGMGGAVAAGFIEGKFLSDANLTFGAQLSAILFSALAVGFIEEICKFVPLAVYIYKKRFFNEHTDGVIYFALAGIGFGLPENILYTIQFGIQAGKLRLILTPLFHAASTGLVGYFLIKRKLSGKRAWGIAGILISVAILHGLYNFGLIAGVGMYVVVALIITLGLSSGLFMAYLRATQLDQDLGLSAVGHNTFCRSCGQPNPEHHLYCAHCGKRA